MHWSIIRHCEYVSHISCCQVRISFTKNYGNLVVELLSAHTEFSRVYRCIECVVNMIFNEQNGGIVVSIIRYYHVQNTNIVKRII